MFFALGLVDKHNFTVNELKENGLGPLGTWFFKFICAMDHIHELHDSNVPDIYENRKLSPEQYLDKLKEACIKQNDEEEFITSDEQKEFDWETLKTSKLDEDYKYYGTWGRKCKSDKSINTLLNSKWFKKRDLEKFMPNIEKLALSKGYDKG